MAGEMRANLAMASWARKSTVYDIKSLADATILLIDVSVWRSEEFATVYAQWHFQ